jgi:hypothetical protein
MRFCLSFFPCQSIRSASTIAEFHNHRINEFVFNFPFVAHRSLDLDQAEITD